MGNRSNPAARSAAYFIMFIGLIATGLSLGALLSGNRDLSLQICGGGVVIGILVLLFGGFVAGSNRPTQ